MSDLKSENGCIIIVKIPISFTTTASVLSFLWMTTDKLQAPFV